MEWSERFSGYMETAIQQRASDLYLIPGAAGYRLMLANGMRFEQLATLLQSEGQQLIQYIKYQAQMDIGECRRPQVGGWAFTSERYMIRLRVAAVATVSGLESLVVRLLFPLAMTELNWQRRADFRRLCQTLSSQQGLVLLAGQMGSGKTTTLHAALNELAEERLILTIEEPVELFNSNYIQLEVNHAADLTYHALLRIALRQRANVIMIGEIRDQDTAKLAIEAALSGHLVVSTIHARSTRGIWLRLLDLGVQEQQLTEVIVGMGYQRLIFQEGRAVVDLDFAGFQMTRQLLKQKKDFAYEIHQT